MKTTMKLGVCLVASLALAACKSEDKSAKPAEKKSNEVKKEKPPEPAKVEPLTGEALAKWYLDCWGFWNAGDYDKFKGCYADDVVSVQVDTGMPEMKGVDAVVENSKMFRAAFSDQKGEPQLVLVNGRTIATVALITGTHTGPLKGPMGELPATNKKVGQLIVHMVEVNEANKVSKEWFIQDGGSMMFQLGLSPGPGRAAMDKGMDGAPIVVVAADSDTEKANVADFNAGIEAFNQHDAAKAMASAADDIVESDQSAPADVKGKKDVEKGTKEFMGAFSDGKASDAKVWCAGDYVFAMFTFSGTNDGKMMGMKPTGKPVTSNVVEIAKYEGGKVKVMWRFFNSTAMAMQMGLIPAPGAAPAEGGGEKKEEGKK